LKSLTFPAHLRVGQGRTTDTLPVISSFNSALLDFPMNFIDSSSSLSVRDYGIYLLNKNLLDGEVYIDYVLELLRNSNEKSDSAGELHAFLLDCNIGEEKVVEITVKLTKSYQRGFLETEETEEMNQPLTSPVPPPPGLLDQQSLTSDQSFSILESTDEEEEDPLENDISTYSCEIDWISLIESLESHLLTYYHYSKPEFSPLALMIALYNGNYGYNLDYSAQLLLNASRILNECKPCRHLMQGSCLRKDCYFEHNLKLFPCRYWLFSVCANEPQQQQTQSEQGEEQRKDILELTQSTSCLFLHDLPSYEHLQYIPPVIPIPEFPLSSSSSSSVSALETPESSSSEQEQQPVKEEIEEIIEEFPTLMASSSNKKNNQKKGQNVPKVSPYLSAVKTSSSTNNSERTPSSSSSVSNEGVGITTITNYKKVFSDLLINAHFISSPATSSLSRSGTKFHSTEWVESGYRLPRITLLFLFLFLIPLFSR
jgi:hypothetical protein